MSYVFCQLFLDLMQEYAELGYLISRLICPVVKTWQNIYKTLNVSRLFFPLSPDYSGRKKIDISLKRDIGMKHI